MKMLTEINFKSYEERILMLLKTYLGKRIKHQVLITKLVKK